MTNAPSRTKEHFHTKEWERLSDEAQELIWKHQNEKQVPVGKLAGALGLSVKAATLPPGISGEILPDTSDTGFSHKIRINRHEIKHRQRFTIAHEIAHFLLHTDMIGTGIADDKMYRSTLSDKYEAEANRLAAEILMPWRLVERAVSIDGNNTEMLAQSLGVSETAIKIRLGIPLDD